MNLFPVTHSVLSQRAIQREILPLYFMELPADCRLLTPGMNDTYLIRSPHTQYVLRAYRHGHRTLPDIQHEHQLLIHLLDQGVRVSAPVRTRDGTLLSEVLAPEGSRYLSMFTYARGTMKRLTPEVATSYGNAVSRLHQAMQTFKSTKERQTIDLHHLLDERVPWILPLLEHRPHDQTFVEQVWRFLKDQIVSMAPLLTWGVCHGDLNGGNARETASES